MKAAAGRCRALPALPALSPTPPRRPTPGAAANNRRLPHRLPTPLRGWLQDFDEIHFFGDKTFEVGRH